MKAAKKPPRSRKPKVTAAPPADYVVPAGKVLVLRTCLSDMRSPSSDANGFRWPRSGPVECPDWSATPSCGNGLHGALWGEGSGGTPWAWEDSGVWLVVEVAASDVVDLGGKVKFPRGVVVLAGPRLEATTFLARLAPGRLIIGGTATAGYGGTATAGYRGTATAGYGGTATAGYRGTATAGDRGTATAGEGGTATAGYRGTATAGDEGTATAGEVGTATAGEGGTATAGEGGEVRIRQWDSKANRYRTRVAWAGENGIKAGVRYRLSDAGEFVEVKS